MEKKPNLEEKKTDKILAGKYRLEKLIGVGAHGEVFKAQVIRTNQTVASKIFYRHLQSEILQFILKELRVISLLSHPHIFPVLAYGRGKYEGEMVHYLVTPLMQGPNVAELLKKGKVPLEEALQIAIDMASALEYMHEKKFIHRDVKPSNILLDEAGNAVLSDFGIACVVDRTQTTAAGTVEYCAPEQMDEQGCKPHPRWDIYGLGITLYEMLTGLSPYREIAAQQGHAAALKYKYEKEYLPITAYGAFPEGLNRVVQKMTTNEPMARYQDMKKVREELAKYQSAKAPAPQQKASSVQLSSLLSQLDLLLQQKAWEKALQKVEEILVPFPSCARAYYSRGKIFLEKKLYRKALENFHLALKHRPNSYLSQCERGYTYLCLEDFNLAYEDLDKAAKAFPTKATAFFYLAMLYKKRAEKYKNQGKVELHQVELKKMTESLAQYQDCKKHDSHFEPI